MKKKEIGQSSEWREFTQALAKHMGIHVQNLDLKRMKQEKRTTLKHAIAHVLNNAVSTQCKTYIIALMNMID